MSGHLMSRHAKLSAHCPDSRYQISRQTWIISINSDTYCICNLSRQLISGQDTAHGKLMSGQSKHVIAIHVPETNMHATFHIYAIYAMFDRHIKQMYVHVCATCEANGINHVIRSAAHIKQSQ